MSRVFIFERVRANIESLKVFGEITYIFEADDERSSIWETQDLRAEIAEQLQELQFNPAQDFFAIVGAVIPITLVIAVLESLFPAYRVLYWQAEAREYVPRLMDKTRQETAL